MLVQIAIVMGHGSVNKLLDSNDSTSKFVPTVTQVCVTNSLIPGGMGEKMKIFISGGCKNGKSTYAQMLSVRNKRDHMPLYYVATMSPNDSEDAERIARHVKERSGMGFHTVEIPIDIENILRLCDTNGSFLLDSITALLANEMFRDGHVNHNASKKICEEMQRILNHIKHIVIVSDYIYSDAGIYEQLTEEYRRSLAMIDRTCVNACDVVLEACCGNFIVHKGDDSYGKIG